MKKFIKIIAVLLLVVMCMSVTPLTAHAEETDKTAFITVQFEMVEGCTYPIYVELCNLNTFEISHHILYATNNYRHVFTVMPGSYAVAARVDGDNMMEYPIMNNETYEVSSGANALITLSFDADVAQKIIDSVTIPELPTTSTEPSEPTDTTPPATEPTKPTKPSEPSDDEPNKTPGESKPPQNTQTPTEPQEQEERPDYARQAMLRAGFFVLIAAGVALAIIIKKKIDEAARGGDDD